MKISPRMVLGFMALCFLLMGTLCLVVNKATADKGDPEVARMFTLVGASMEAVGLLIAGIAVYLTYKHKNPKKARLVKAGYSVVADIIEFPEDTSFTLNGRYRSRVVCKYGEHVFESRWFFDDRSLITDTKVAVWVNKDNPDDYYVDVDAFFTEPWFKVEKRGPYGGRGHRW